MARPNLSALFSKFLFRETLTSDEKGYIRSDIGAETAGSAATAQALAISTAAADATSKVAAAVSDEAYDASTWNGSTVAPTKNAVRDKIVAMDTAIDGKQPLDSDLTALAAAGNSAVLAATTASFTTADETKLDEIPLVLLLDVVPVTSEAVDVSGMIGTDGNGRYSPSTANAYGPTWIFYSDLINPPFNLGQAATGQWVIDMDGSVLFSRTSPNPWTVGGNPWIAEGASGILVATQVLPPTGTLGQTAIVTHSDGTQTEWGCVDISPMTWLPRTAGIFKNRDTSQWERTFIQNSTIQTEILPNQ